MTTATLVHGTYGGYQAHRKRGETPCQNCRDANARYSREKRADVLTRRKDRWWNNTKQAALVRLAHEHPERFAEILAEIRAVTPAEW